MTKLIKVCVIAGSICVLLGGTIAGVAKAMGANASGIIAGNSNIWQEIVSEFISDDFDHFNFYNEHEDLYQDTSEASKQDFLAKDVKNLTVKVRSGEVLFMEDSPNDEIKISCDENETYYSSKLDKDELIVQITSDKKPVLKIHVPKDFQFSKVYMDTTHRNYDIKYHKKNNSPTIVAKNVSADEMKLVSSVGKIIIDKGNVGKLDINCDVGDIDYTGISKQLDIDCNVGDVDYTGTVAGDIHAQCSVGNIHLKLAAKKDDYNYKAHSELGSVSIDGKSISNYVDNGADKEMVLDCSVGVIGVDIVEEK